MPDASFLADKPPRDSRRRADRLTSFQGSRFSPRSSPSSIGPSTCSRAASYSSRVSASRASPATRPVRPVPPFATSMRQLRRRYERSRRGSSRPPSSSSSSVACSASASSRESRSSTGGSPDELTGLLQVDAVLRDDHLQVLWGTAQVAAPLPVEDLGVVGVGLEYDAVLDEVEDRRVL
jgi:hypothetical protein